MVQVFSAEILDTELVSDTRREITTTENTSTAKLETEDAQEEILTFSNAESMVDQTTETLAPKLMSDVQEDHGYLTTPRLVKNSELPEKAGLKEEEVTDHGDHSLLITSGITTTELPLFAEILDMVKVSEPEPETKTTSDSSIQKLETEDVLVETLEFSNAESMVDQTKVISVLKLMSDAMVNHGYQSMLELAVNSE
jgi:hypothetical protein